MRTAVAVDPEEQKWRRRSDARTLAEAEQIKADKERYKGAIIGAKEIAQEEIDRVRGIAKVAGMKTPRTSQEEIPAQKQQNTMYGCRHRNPATIGRL